MNGTTPNSGLLVCPETRLGLRTCSRAEATEKMGASALIARSSNPTFGAGSTSTVMLREDNGCAYPVIEGIPVLLLPEQLVADNAVRPAGAVDIADPRYAESYDEMAHYNLVAQQEAAVIESSVAAAGLSPVLRLSPEQRRTFPKPRRAWVDAAYEPVSQWEAFGHLSPVQGKTVLQVGGKGTHAVRFLLAGATEAWVISPMLEELRHGAALARHMGLEDSYHSVVGIAEEMPFLDGSFDAIYSESCVHHMVTELASTECHRILRRGGRFAAVEPWRAPLYGWGIKVFGKREKGVHCQPMTASRAEPFRDVFDDVEIVHHGALTRYPLLALAQLGCALRPVAVYAIMRCDDALASLIPRVRRTGSSVVILGTRSH